MTETIEYLSLPLDGVDAMRATTTRSYPRHSHDQYGIGVIDDGGHSSWSGRGQVEAGPQSLICCNPGEVHDGRAVGGVARTWRMLYLDPELVGALRSDILSGQPGELTFANPVFGNERARLQLDRVLSHARRPLDAPNRMECETALLKFFATLRCETTDSTHRRTSRVASIKSAKDRIDADPAAALTLADLAREAGLSRFQLLRAFSRELGLTPHAYILQQRLHLARRLLRARCGLAETSARAGFYDQPHLNRCFLRQYGVTPGQYAARRS